MDRAVLAVFPVEDGQGRVDAQTVPLGGDQAVAATIRGENGRRASAVLPAVGGDGVQGTLVAVPAALLADADEDQLVLLLVDGADDGLGGL